MKFNLALLFVVALPFGLTAQKMDLGKVTIAQLQQKQYAADTSAVAAVLYKKGETALVFSKSDGFSMVTKCTKRVKIFKKGGYDLANFSIPFYLGKENERVAIDDAVTYNLVNGKIEKSKLKSDGEFTEKSSKHWSRKKVVMPNVREGSVIEYTYKITSPYFQNMPDWSFQETIPVEYAEFQTAIPEYFDYQVHVKGSLKPQVTSGSNLRRFEGKERVKNVRTGLMEDDVYSIEYQDIVTNYVMKNVPALNDESYVNNISNYTSSLSHELSSTRDREGKVKTYTTDWESVVKNINENPDFGQELSKKGFFETDMNTALVGAASEQQKVSQIFNHVKNAMNWDGTYGYICDKGVKKAYQEKTGNTAEINLILTAMLRTSGHKANPVLISTRSNGVSIYPGLASFNHVIACVEIDGKMVLLDASDKSAGFDLLPKRDLNWFGRIIRADGSSDLIDIMPKNKSREIVNITGSIDASGKYSGQLKHQYFEHNALEYRETYAKIKEESYLEMLEKSHSGCTVSNFKREIDKEAEKPVSESYAFEHTASVEVIGDRIYVSPMAFFSSANPFKQQSRDYPVDFVFPNQEKFNISLALPDGYVVESIPSVLSLSMPNDFGTFKYVIQAKEKSVQIAINYDRNEAIVPTDHYESLSEFYQKMSDKQNEKIVLKKI